MVPLDPLDVEITKKTLIPLLSKLIQNRCVNLGRVDSGFETKNALLLQGFFKEGKIDSELLGSLEDRKSLVLCVEGSDEKPLIYALMGHLDVVDADPKNWDFDPFSGDFDGEWVYGRGTVDMLNQVAVMSTALREVIALYGRPLRTIKFFAFADEEADGVLGAESLLKEYPEKLQSDYMLSELGGYFIDENHIAISPWEKGVLRIHLTVKGTAAHGSMPYRADNAALKMVKAITLIEENLPVAVYTDEALEMIHKMPLEDSFKKLLLNSETLYQGLEGVYEKSPGIGKLIHSALHLTASLGVFRSGNKVNVIPDFAEADFDFRIQQGQTKETVLEWIHSLMDELGVQVESREYFPPNTSSYETPLKDAIAQITSEFYPTALLVPVVPAGVTDGRFFRSTGTQVYGFSLFSKKYTYDTFATRLHGRNEKIDFESLVVAFSFYKRLLLRILYSENN